jgi:cytoskeletal protein CcmA (bactofilin family)
MALPTQSRAKVESGLVGKAAPHPEEGLGSRLASKGERLFVAGSWAVLEAVSFSFDRRAVLPECGCVCTVAGVRDQGKIGRRPRCSLTGGGFCESLRANTFDLKKQREDMSSSKNPPDNFLSLNVELKGNLGFVGELMFDGKLEGDIISDGVLTLGDNAVINGNIRVGSVVVRGTINGTITARDRIDIKSNTQLFGDVTGRTLVIEEGATFVGRSDVNPKRSDSDAVSSPTPATSNQESPAARVTYPSRPMSYPRQ